VTFHAGQTFLYPLNDETLCEHLWVIATEPNDDGQFAIASFTTLRGAKDQTVIFQRDEHPFLKWDTCVIYALAEISTVDKLAAYLDCGNARMHHDVPPPMLCEILAGFTASDYTKNRVRDFVRDYRRQTRRH
jgi:hypothetical protein